MLFNAGLCCGSLPGGEVESDDAGVAHEQPLDGSAGGNGEQELNLVVAGLGGDFAFQDVAGFRDSAYPVDHDLDLPVAFLAPHVPDGGVGITVGVDEGDCGVVAFLFPDVVAVAPDVDGVQLQHAK